MRKSFAVLCRSIDAAGRHFGYDYGIAALEQDVLLQAAPLLDVAVTKWHRNLPQSVAAQDADVIDRRKWRDAASEAQSLLYFSFGPSGILLDVVAIDQVPLTGARKTRCSLRSAHRVFLSDRQVRWRRLFP